MRTALGPLHLLALDHPLADHLIQAIVAQRPKKGKISRSLMNLNGLAILFSHFRASAIAIVTGCPKMATAPITWPLRKLFPQILPYSKKIRPP
jgi:hypothetical protein